MATNIIYQPGEALSVAVTHPAEPESGDPVRYGELTGVALTDEGDGGNSATHTTVYFGPCVVEMSVRAINDGGNSAVAAGDVIYYVDGDTPALSKKASGRFFGIAAAAVTAGQTATIRLIKPAPVGVAVNVSDQFVKHVSVPVAAVDAVDATAVIAPLFVTGAAITVQAAYFIPATTQAGADTNTATLALRNIGDNAAGTDDVATFEQTDTNDLTANVAQNLGTITNAAVAAGDVLAWHRTKVGDGINSPAGTVVIEYTVDD